MIPNSWMALSMADDVTVKGSGDEYVFKLKAVKTLTCWGSLVKEFKLELSGVTQADMERS